MKNQYEMFLNETEPAEPWVLFSLYPEYYEQVRQGSKRMEYRRGGFLRSSAHAFIYCTAPVKEIGLVARLGSPVVGSPSEISAIKEAQEPGSYHQMMAWLEGRKTVSATPILDVQSFTAICWDDLKREFPAFQAPQSFIYLHKQPKLLAWLKKKAGLL